MTADEQLQGWLEGRPTCPNDRGECCPDFSCCQANLLADVETRQHFIDGDEDKRMQMCGMFLGAAFEKAADNKKIYVAGLLDGGNA